MGDKSASDLADPERLRAFMRALLDDVAALERMLETDAIESGVRRIGAEQEFFLVGAGGEPAPLAMEVLERLDDPAFTTELARFNLEANLPPYEFRDDCLGRMESDLGTLTERARAAARACGADVLLAGILPTLRLSDLSLKNMTPVPRYAALNEVMARMRGGAFNVHIKGIDELNVTHDNVMLESCNTAFQVHFQVGAAEFPRLYNLAQAVTAPVLAAAVNSPCLLEHRLWQETRVALFQHAVDHRTDVQRARGQRPRVRFGSSWVDASVLEIFREDIARFRVILASDVEEKPLQMLDRGEVPALRALCMHNGTVYRWNRPCYGVYQGKAHLRIENRVLPAGPSIVDQVANAAFFHGLMSALSATYRDITKVMSFDDAKGNFLAAARHGLQAQFTWLEGRTCTAADLILEHLIPVAAEGLRAHHIDPAHVDHYLGILDERVRGGRTGSHWALQSLQAMGARGSPHDRSRALTAAMLDRQRERRPVHEWELAVLEEAKDWRHSYRTVGQFMTKDLFTVQPDDLMDLAANLMDWEHIRHVPVEDDQGRLVGLVSHRGLIRLLARGAQEPVPVRDIMRQNPVTVTPETPTIEAMDTMRREQVGALPVVQGDRLVGIVTERDFIDVSAQLLDEQLRGFGPR